MCSGDSVNVREEKRLAVSTLTWVYAGAGLPFVSRKDWLLFDGASMSNDDFLTKLAFLLFLLVSLIENLALIGTMYRSPCPIFPACKTSLPLNQQPLHHFFFHTLERAGSFSLFLSISSAFQIQRHRLEACSRHTHCCTLYTMNPYFKTFFCLAEDFFAQSVMLLPFISPCSWNKT